MIVRQLSKNIRILTPNEAHHPEQKTFLVEKNAFFEDYRNLLADNWLQELLSVI